MFFNLSETQRQIQRSKPVFIAAPVGRCGTTAVQRLFHSDPEMMVFAEHHYFFKFCNRTLGQFYYFYERRHKMRDNLEGSLDQLKDSWLHGPLPSARTYMSGFLRSLYEFADSYRIEAERLGRKRWGFKQPSVDPIDLHCASRLFPGSQVIFLERPIADVIRSFKSYQTESFSTERICKEWFDRMVAWAPYRNKIWATTLRYQDLKHPMLTERLAELTGCALSPEPLAVKVNNKGGYTPPAELTDQDNAIIARAERLYLEKIGRADYLPSVLAGRDSLD